MGGILDVLRAAATPVAEARTGYIQGQEFRKHEDEADAERNREVTRQQAMDAEEQRRYNASMKRQSVLDTTRQAVEQAQAEELRSRGKYYAGGGAAGARFRGSGKNGALTPKDRAAYIRMKSMARYDPDTGAMEPAMSAADAAAEFDTIVAGSPAGPGSSGDGMASMRSRGAGIPLGATTAPQGQRSDAASKTPTSPLAATRAAIASPSAGTAPTAPVDSATLAKKYPFLFGP